MGRGLARVNILNAVNLAREWIGTDIARQLVVNSHHYDAVPDGRRRGTLTPPTLAPLDRWPERTHPSPEEFREWLATTLRRYKKRPLLVPIVWRDHYSGLYLPKVHGAPAVFMDPHSQGQLGYAYPPLDIIRSVVKRPVVEVGLCWQVEEADVFCAVWVVWWFSTRHRWRHGPPCPATQAEDTTRCLPPGGKNTTAQPGWYA